MYGNHDVHTDEITDDDSLKVLSTAGRIRPARFGPLLPEDHQRAISGDRWNAVGGNRCRRSSQLRTATMSLWSSGSATMT